jgi:flavin-dependent dehydrogenase
MNVSPGTPEYDVVIIGGALAGAATALVALQQDPHLKILIVEKSAAFGRRVGEATVEVSAYFLGRTLGLTQHLNEAHLVKQGMRFWFQNARTRNLEDCSEVGGRYLSRVPAYQVDRAVLDEEVLRRAQAAGAEVLRPASAARVQLTPAGLQTVEIRAGAEAKTIRTRWIVDASGVAALLARQQGWWRANAAHPTSAVWARWTGVQDWDGLELSKKYPGWSMACHGIRGTATNHFVGPGWWAWCIPLKGGDVSIGMVFDQRLVDWPEGGTLAERLKHFLMRHPAAAEIIADAHCREGDVHWRKNLPYYSTTFVGDGFALVGDAAAFLDPFYSPGMDWIAYTSWNAVELILAQKRDENLAPLLEKRNRVLSRSYARWFEAIYQDKYEYMGDYELMGLAFLLDLGFYYLGVASQPFKRGSAALGEPVFSLPVSTPFFHLMHAYNRRFAAMARSRRARQAWGRRNHGRRWLVPGYTLSGSSAWPIVKALLGWGRLEMTEGWRSWFGYSGKKPSGQATAAANLQPVRQPDNVLISG